MAADPEIHAKLLIPEELANHICCPVCGSICLSLRRSLDEADQLSCDSCKASFEISTDGEFVRLITPPPGLPTDLLGHWVDPRDVAARGKNAVIAARQQEAELSSLWKSAPAPTIDTATLCEHAQQLLSLGNPREEVQHILESTRGVSAEQVAAAMACLPEPEKRRGSWFYVGLGTISLLVIAIAVVVGLGLAHQRAQSTAETDNLPPAARALLNSGMAIMNIEPVKVTRLSRSGARLACPTQPANAARMFGGDSGAWSPLQASWTMITSHPQAIYLPEGMRAEYLLLVDPPSMVAIQGPARLSNVVYISITCGK
jgi:hypothetical protein